VSTADEDEQEALLDPEAEAELLAALEAALRPGVIDPERHERFIEMAIEDPLAPPSEDELAESARLRDALAQGTADEDADLLRGLGAAFGASKPPSVGGTSETSLAAALEKPARSNVVYRAFGLGSLVLAAAAAALVFVSPLRKSAPEAAASGAALPRSTTPLFTERFETQDTTARMDRIASARGRDLRDNRFASWGVP
jgi:hypothetical protein